MCISSWPLVITFSGLCNVFLDYFPINIQTLQDKLDDSAFKILTDYQAATVTLLALMSASTGDVSKYFLFRLLVSFILDKSFVEVDP